MKLFMLICVVITMILASNVSANDYYELKDWVEVKTKVKGYTDYTMKKSNSFVEPGKYSVMSEQSDYYQIADSIYLKKDNMLASFRVANDTSVLQYHPDSVSAHRAIVSQQLIEKTTISPLIFLFFGLVIVIMIATFIIN